jgi:hypothetical protein
MVAFLVDVPPPFIAGVGALNAAVPLCTEKVTLPVVPMAVTTDTFLSPCPAPLVIAQFAWTIVAVGVPLIVQVTPAPETVIEEAVARLVPVNTTGTVVPREPNAGAIEVSVGPCTVNVTPLLVPIGAVTVTVWAPSVAAAVMAQFAVRLVAVGVPVIEQVTPVPETLTAVTPARLLPASVTGTVVPRTPELGVIEVSETGAFTVNVTVLVVPFGVTTAIPLPPVAAPEAMARFAVTVVSFTTVKPETVMLPP